MKKIVDWAHKSRESGYLVLENIAIDEDDRFINKGLNLLADGIETDQFHVTLELDIELYREHNLRSATIFESMGGLQPDDRYIGCGTWADSSDE